MKRRHWLFPGLLGGAMVALAVMGGSAAYFAATRPAPLALPDPSRSGSPALRPSAPSDPLLAGCPEPSKRPPARRPAGLWIVADGSQGGYRAREKWAELPSPHEAVARTERVGGWLSMSGVEGSLSLDSGCFAMDLTTLKSIDSLPGFRVSDRDRTVQDILNTSRHPIARFLPQSVVLPAGITSGQTVARLTVPGEIDVNGAQRPSSAVMDVRYDDGSVTAAGSTTVIAEDHGIELPKAADFVSVDSTITIEFALILRPA